MLNAKITNQNVKELKDKELLLLLLAHNRKRSNQNVLTNSGISSTISKRQDLGNEDEFKCPHMNSKIFLHKVMTLLAKRIKQ